MTSASAGKNSSGEQSPGSSGFALLALGFRPFYLLAGAFGMLSIVIWALQFMGYGPAVLQGPQWHAHEMLWGYTFAVITGFLFTAVRNWTQRPTPTGARLALLAIVWLAGRLLAFTPWPAWSALTDTLFTLAVAFGIARPLAASGNRRNYFFVALLLALGAANLAFIASLRGLTPFAPDRALAICLDIVLFVMAVMAGRVVPMFTNNAIHGAGARRLPALERAALGLILVLIACDLAGEPAAAAAVSGIAAIVHGARLTLWSPLATRRNPLLWILHASYAWIVVHLALRAAAGPGWIPSDLATHALTIGAIGGLTLGMMTRSARGHTARPLVAGRAETGCFWLIQLAAASRVLLPIMLPALYIAEVALSGLLWSAAFALFTISYWPVLIRPRLDGQPG